jgi:hypothetical protein
VPYTNLVLMVIHKTCPCQANTIKIDPQKIDYSKNSSERCSLLFGERYRKRPTTCHNYHPKVMICNFNRVFKYSIKVMNEHSVHRIKFFN